LYLNQGEDPAEWRCLSRRDALRITDEIRSLLGAGETGQESHLPTVADVNTGARYLFGRRDRSQEAAKLAGAVREVEANLTRRLSRLEGEVADHSSHIQDLRSKSVEAEQSMGRLLSAVEGFCEQAAIRLETVTAPAPAALASAAAASSMPASLPAAPVSVPPPADTPAPLSAVAPMASAPPVWSPTPSVDSPVLTETDSPAWWRSPTAISAGLIVAAVLMGMLLWPSRPASPPDITSASEPVKSSTKPIPAAPTPASTTPEQPAAAPSVPAASIAAKSVTVGATAPAAVAKAPGPLVVGATRIELEATEPSWISIRGGDGATQVARLIEPGTIQSVDIREPAVLRAGNAGGLTIRANGKTLGPLGPHGAVREVSFRDGDFKLVPVK
jgi:hypothetical protein